MKETRNRRRNGERDEWRGEERRKELGDEGLAGTVSGMLGMNRLIPSGRIND